MTIETRIAPAVAQPKTVGDVLRHAARLIEEFGWIQGGYGDAGTGYCLIGSVAVAADGTTLDWADCKIDIHSDHPLRPIYDAALDQIRALLDREPEGWNDEFGRTAAEVTAALRAAAEEADRG